MPAFTTRYIFKVRRKQSFSQAHTDMELYGTVKQLCFGYGVSKLTGAQSRFIVFSPQVFFPAVSTVKSSILPPYLGHIKDSPKHT